MTDIKIRLVSTKADKQAFVDLPFRLYAGDPNWVSPLKSEVMATITPGKNPWFEHGEAQLFLAERDGHVVGRISAHLDYLALAQPPEQGMGPGAGNWGFFEAEDADVAKVLLETAEGWLRDKKMVRALGPLSLSYWEEIGLLVQGHDHPPAVLMGHHNPAYGAWIQAAGYAGVKDLYTYQIPIDVPFPPLVQRIVAMGERNDRIVIRKVNKANFEAEAAIILSILNNAWSGNWGFVPITDAEVAHAGKQLKPIVFNDLIRIAEVDGEPVAFMMTWPDINEKIGTFGGSLFPFNWAKLLWWLRAPKVRTMRVPLMGVVKKLQSTRIASQLAFMMVTYIREASTSKFGATRGEFGWVLDDNGPMRSVGEAMNGEINKVYRLYEKPL